MAKNPYIVKSDGKLAITKRGYKFLQKIVTDPYGDVYAFTDEAPRLLAAASMARLSRSAQNLRKTYLLEFAATESAAPEFIEKVVAGFGDDSVKQLIYVLLVVEGASNLLTKKLEWGRFAGYLEQSTRYIYFDQKDESGRYKYYIPQNLPPEIKLTYTEHMNTIFDNYSYIVRELTDFVRLQTKEPKDKLERAAWLGATRAQACDAARVLLPSATQSTVGIVAPAQSVENLIYFLASQTLAEAQETAKVILRESKKVVGPFLKQVERPERGGAAIVYRQDTSSAVANLAKSYFGGFSHSVSNSAEVTLVDWWPKGDELDILVPEMLFSEMKMPVKMLQNRVQTWPREQKLEVFNSYVGERLNYRHKPGRAFEKIHHEWELLIDYGKFRDLQRHRVLDMPEWQRLSPAYGYDVPKLVKESGMENMFQNCFELSEDLYNYMNGVGLAEEAQYATLLGHKMRFRFMMNAREAFHLLELRTQPQGHPGYRQVCIEMHKLLSEIHPLSGAAMKFVDKGEDPELTRMAAELATQRKLSLLKQENPVE
ncbi:hypothetical protein A3G55_04370 [Candidatus Giovannonibacteria bacterium RIFCSPLOWO2_12_FULL_44_25]|uniref:Thymidylate synthase complementing protein ThyX n=3 Tax=Parcubacteria group TaxID=1794811 RepID=A0A837IJH9_9BACT|nr:MAG: hypothetical protein UW15_C0002G0039 [Parcubacteria group bacterium GW2011_GWC1_44_10]KKT59954.1 MAG: hypothetical protein UW53_C0005G0037 [Candidatus Giovannonibacteria bacterium GW2011_GWA1_44_25]KKU12434.1 MAG: hypothetical protein UX18_C0024G0003 [Candidatus Azambacteria bacterium GW2011_GWC2_45_7b]KKU29731.1 MAG: hypothetical protein UX43_C0006G0006 [Candidatus Giovannonibacteria bacterium GW2011_GWB1_46_20]OGF49161.1 MAG: hypothetical protein A2120_01750 [Candidatus Giovannonibact